MTKRALAAVLTCALMAVVALAPVVAGTSHEILKGGGGSNANAVSWEFVPATYCNYSLHIVNNGLRWLVINVYDNSTGALEEIMHQKIRFAAYDAYPYGEVTSKSVTMSPTHKYVISAMPSGPKGTYCSVEDMFIFPVPPVPIFTATTDYLTVFVNATSSYDADGYIISYDWSFGDGGVASGVTANHTYGYPGVYVVTLYVKDNDGLANSTALDVPIYDFPPTASFTILTHGLTVIADASGSWDDYGIVDFQWDWGDGTTGSGATATHTYGDALLPASAAPRPTLEVNSGPMFQIVGYTFDSSLNALAGCNVKVTNTRTGDTFNTVGDEYGFYTVYNWDLPHGIASGDLINVTATTGAAIGWNEGAVDLEYGFLWLDVILNPAQNGGIRNYTITLTVKDTNGQTDVMSKEVAVAPLPVASFTYTVSGSTVYVDAAGSSAEAGIISYSWDWGDGTTGVGMTTSHTYGSSSSASTVTTSQVSTQGLFVIFGFVYLPDGVTPAVGATVTVTNLNSLYSETMISDEYGYWSTGLNNNTGGPPDSGGPANGDLINVTVTKDYMIGWNGGVVDYYLSYLWLDVYLEVSLTRLITLTITDSLGQTSSTAQLVAISNL